MKAQTELITKRLDYSMSELTRELLFTYCVSMLARYRVKLWNKIIAGEGSQNLMWKIEDYLRSTQLFFPNLIFNKLHGRRYSFFPESRMGADFSISTNISDFNRVSI